MTQEKLNEECCETHTQPSVVRVATQLSGILLIDGVKDGFLINPKVLDARTEITTQLLSDEGYAVVIANRRRRRNGNFCSRDFEKKFFSEKTNSIFCQTFLENALRDPITNEIGKTIIFAVSQNHARKLTEMLNEFAEQLFPASTILILRFR
jgi:type I restriction enzyme, R subunit